jgi:predicted DNA-binding transcriptional regulator AlpA
VNLLTLPEVIARTGLSRTTFWRVRQRGEFPAAVSIGHLRCAMWRSSEVDEWIRQRGLTGRVHRDP